MLGGNGGIKLWIELHNSPEFYTNGDQLYGTMFVESSKPFSVHNIEVKLRCEEQAYVWVNNSQGGYYEVETLRHLSHKATVFPDRDIPFQNSDSTYTLQSGTHNFDFQFRIPMSNKYPGSLQVRNSSSAIKWYVKGVMHRGNVLTPTKRTFAAIKMSPTPELPHNPGSMGSMGKAGSTANMTVFLPSYAEVSKTTAGRLRGLLPSSQFKKRSGVRLEVVYPTCGLLQEPTPICLEIDISSEDDDLLLLKSLSLYLKQKIVVSVGDGWRTSVHREVYHVWSSPEFNISLKKGLHNLHELLKEVRVQGRLYETFCNKHFNVSYKLVAEAQIACRIKPTSTERLRVSVPVNMHSFLSGQMPSMRPQDQLFEELPAYQAEPRIGEETVNVQQMQKT